MPHGFAPRWPRSPRPSRARPSPPCPKSRPLREGDQPTRNSPKRGKNKLLGALAPPGHPSVQRVYRAPAAAGASASSAGAGTSIYATFPPPELGAVTARRCTARSGTKRPRPSVSRCLPGRGAPAGPRRGGGAEAERGRLPRSRPAASLPPPQAPHRRLRPGARRREEGRDAHAHRGGPDHSTSSSRGGYTPHCLPAGVPQLHCLHGAAGRRSMDQSNPSPLHGSPPLRSAPRRAATSARRRKPAGSSRPAAWLGGVAVQRPRPSSPGGVVYTGPPHPSGTRGVACSGPGPARRWRRRPVPCVGPATRSSAAGSMGRPPRSTPAPWRCWRPQVRRGPGPGGRREDPG